MRPNLFWTLVAHYGNPEPTALLYLHGGGYISGVVRLAAPVDRMPGQYCLVNDIETKKTWVIDIRAIAAIGFVG